MKGVAVGLALAATAWLAPAPAHAQATTPTFRSASSATLGGGSVNFRAASSAATTSGTLVIAKPVGTVDGDVMIASIGVRPPSATITAPAGWILVRRINNASATANALAVYRKLAGAAEPASYSWTLAGSTHTVGGIQSFSGVNAANPISVENGRTTPWALTHPTPSISTTVANTVLVTSHTFSSAAAWTPPAGMTEGFDITTPASPNSAGQAIVGSWVRQAAAGSTGVKTASASNDGDVGNTHILALQPPATLSIGMPAGAAANDVMIASIGVRPPSATITPPPGWTLVRRINNASAAANSLAVYRKVVGAGESGSYAWGVSGASFAVGGIQAFYNVDTANPIDVENGRTTPSALGHPTPSVTTTLANTMVVTSHTFASARTWTPPAGMAESFDQSSGAANTTGQSIAGNRVLQTGVGPTGVKTATAAADADAGNTHILALRPATSGPTPTPFTGTPIPVPGTFEAENFDLGGEGVAYHDNTIGNAGGQYRPSEDVDIIVSADPLGGSYVVSNFEAGEWLAYTINVAQSATYRIELRASSSFPNSAFHVEIDGVNVTGAVAVPNTGSPSVFQNASKGGIALSQGQHSLRLAADQQSFSVNSIRITQDDPRSVVGEWAGPVSLPIVPIHMHLLPDGAVLAWGNPNTPPNDGGAQERVWDPALPQPVFQEVRNPFVDVYCSGHSFLADGRLLVTGGHLGSFVGSSVTTIFDFRTRTWTSAARMNAGRWYPTNTTLANGEVAVVSGTINGETNVNTLPEVWSETGAVRPLTSAQLDLPLYPWMHLAPNGLVFNSGPRQTTRYLDTSGTGSWTTVALTNFGGRQQYSGTSVMYEPGKILILGGNPPTATAEVIDLNSPTPQWQYTNPMAHARRYPNATLLPDGKVLVTGGTTSGTSNVTGAVLAAEVWDPAMGSWSTLAAMSIRRTYHSTAVLLPDGRVFTAGGGGQGGTGADVDHYDAEYYSPPYLFNGARPTISAAPESATFGETFTLETADALNVTKVTLLGLSSTTHEFNQTQRYVPLVFSPAADGTGLSVTVPTNPNLAPPGYYMLFILNSDGVPSVAKMVRIAPPS